jgi:hypothetical protein
LARKRATTFRRNHRKNGTGVGRVFETSCDISVPFPLSKFFQLRTRAKSRLFGRSDVSKSCPESGREKILRGGRERVCRRNNALRALTTFQKRVLDLYF